MTRTNYARLALHDAMKDELRRLDREAKPLDGSGVFIAVRGGYVSGSPYLLTTNYNNAFAFADVQQAQGFIDKFPGALDGPSIHNR